MPGISTSSTCSWTIIRSGATICSSSDVGNATSPSAFHLLCLLHGFFDRAHHVERLLREVIVLAVHNLTEAADGVGDRHVLAGEAGELLGDEERLRQEALDAARPADGQLVFLGELVDAQDRDDV